MNKWRLAIWVAYALMAAVVSGCFSEKGEGPNLEEALQPPSAQHLMGTDHLGRDLASRVVEGSVISLTMAVLAWIGAFTIGMLLGAHSGFLPESKLGRAVSGLIVLIYATPFLVIVAGVVSVLGRGVANAYTALLLVAWAAPARHTAIVVERLRHSTFVLAATSFGFSYNKILTAIVIPQVYRPVLAASLGAMPEILAFDVVLSFLGLGPAPPSPTLGRLLLEGIDYLSLAWWMALFPLAVLSGLCIIIRCLAQNVGGKAYGGGDLSAV
jgi:ABC-type dipeptide/oligopeptide/nickel transport system permease subunit